jgi:hypothetical protein
VEAGLKEREAAAAEAAESRAALLAASKREAVMEAQLARARQAWSARHAKNGSDKNIGKDNYSGKGRRTSEECAALEESAKNTAEQFTEAIQTTMEILRVSKYRSIIINNESLSDACRHLS